MAKNKIQNVIIHVAENTHSQTLASKLAEFHIDIIERRLNQSDLSIEQKIAVIDKIIENLKLRDVNGLIK